MHEIAAVDLSKTYFLKNAKKTCKPNDRDLNRDWIITHVLDIVFITRSHFFLSEIHLKFMEFLVLIFLIGRWSVGQWSVGMWLVVGGRLVSGFKKTPSRMTSSREAESATPEIRFKIWRHTIWNIFPGVRNHSLGSMILVLFSSLADPQIRFNISFVVCAGVTEVF